MIGGGGCGMACDPGMFLEKGPTNIYRDYRDYSPQLLGLQIQGN